tara:strand:- start:342 stop:545 length:204 start_codon:yes stop_codon:yes gene_type:complete
MVVNDIISQVEEAIRIQTDRNDMLKEISQEIGIDISFSDEALMREISDLASKKIAERLEKAVVQSMR